MIPEIILTVMVALQPPGKSIYSKTEVEEGTPAACSEASLLCVAPKWDEERWAFVRPETADEGLVRYRVIANQLSELHDNVLPFALTVIFHESGFREDVHSGLGRWARGGGTDHCLGQIHAGSSGYFLRRYGWTLDDLVGTDSTSTKRCVTIVRDMLRMAIKKCDGDAYCVFSRYAGAAEIPPNWVRNQLEKRRATYHRIRSLIKEETAADS